MSIAEFTSPTEADIIDEYVDKEITTGRKAIYNYIDGDLEPNEMTQEFVSGGFPIVNEVVCAYHEDMQKLEGTNKYPEGYYYIDDSISDLTEQEKKLKGNGIYCTAPCTKVCPVNIVKLHLQFERTQKFETYREKKKDYTPYPVKVVPGFPDQKFFESAPQGCQKLNMACSPYGIMPQPCIGCGKCFKICGYNAIIWINYRDTQSDVLNIVQSYNCTLNLSALSFFVRNN